MSGPHRHAEFIKAKADGATIQYRLGDWHDMDEDDWEFPADGEYRIKPPEPKWPETMMSGEDLEEIYMLTNAGAGSQDFVAVANAAIAHALETGQVVLPDESLGDWEVSSIAGRSIIIKQVKK